MWASVNAKEKEFLEKEKFLENREGLDIIDMRRSGQIDYTLSMNRGTLTWSGEQMPLPLAWEGKRNTNCSWNEEVEKREQGV